MDGMSRPLQDATQREQRRARRARWRLVKRILGVLAALAIVGMLVLAWMPKPLSVEAAKASRGPMRVTVDEDGRTRVKDRYVVSAPLTGNLARIELRAGDKVKEGTVLARIVPLSSPLLDDRSRGSAEARVAAATASREQAKAQIQRAEASLEFAKQDVERERSLRATQSIPQVELDRAEVNARTLTAELASAQFGERVAQYELRVARSALGRIQNRGKADPSEQMEVPSPIDGLVLKIIQQSEGVVQAGTALLELGNPRALEIAVDVLTSDAVRIRPGAPVSIERWGGEPLSGHVRMIEPSAFSRVSALGVEEQRVNAIVDVDAPYERWMALGDGYRVETRIVVWEASDVLAVPASAVFRHGDEWAAYAVEGEVAHLHKVTLGQRDALRVQIVAGLEDGQRVVLHPSDRVVDGVRVAVQ
jgi:HlyD family secretion protein